ncbi:glycosyltransferase [Olsenella sp. HMSC062G07]|uniref:glycosyltransferase n=1 Tax=Olsenella sp. HMSC062G07 TaxID=1739330 RepID=UPI0008A41611|nr:glycosyltransferase [Olsenella sp. HMSC062G07]OFK24626.1 hypothetical protein HMPREF2826_06940 [Olsenella sp. HMSC062G07]
MMVNFRLANVLLCDSERSVTQPSLYWRQSRLPRATEKGSVILADPASERYDFATYFNALSSIKWRRYTPIDNVWLHLRVKGSLTLTLTSYSGYKSPKRAELLTRTVRHDEVADLDVEFPSIAGDLLAFEVATASPVELVEAYYYTKVDEALIRPVELAVATTTFKKEEYILPNVELLRREVGGCDEPVAKHFTLHVVDNGRTLDAQGLSEGCVVVHPNPNVGGSGGYARGMIEALRQTPQATHVILMDDDVEVSPESVKRTFNLLSLVRDEYASALLSGAMLSLEQQDMFREDIGHLDENGMFEPVKRKRSVATLREALRLETMRASKVNAYAGWWYCCIPTAVIRRVGLPLPLFIRGDDTEYGIRCDEPFMTMNGICIWHMTFSAKFRANLDRYQVLRNSLIGQATTGAYPGVDFTRAIRIVFGFDLKNFYYDGCELAIRAIEDYLRGPEYLKRVDGAALMAETGKKNEKVVPLDEIDDPRVLRVSFKPEKLKKKKRRNSAQHLYDYVTENGHRLPDFLVSDEPAVTLLQDYAPNKIRNRSCILAVTADGNEGVLREFDRRRAAALERELRRVLAKLDRCGDEVAASWAAAKDELTSVSFWEDYLRRMAR